MKFGKCLDGLETFAKVEKQFLHILCGLISEGSIVRGIESVGWTSLLIGIWRG
jgi:hypothetical protein